MSKYRPVAPIELQRTWPTRQIRKAPIWCSVDLRDGNQALPTPMNIDEKRELFLQLCAIGFQEIEVGFPAASQTEFDFVRMLIEENLIPDQVSIQVLTQARKDLIDRTFEAIQGAKNVIFHVYNSTSEQQRRLTFAKSVAQIKNIAVQGCQRIVDNLSTDMNLVLEYSPESFSGTELPVALEICAAVLDVWQPEVRGRAIINLPATVEQGPPNHYADQIEYFIQNFRYRGQSLISLHTHNDRGCAVAATELGLLAGADRVEGTLFGNGERTGNTDLVVLALNMVSQGIDPGLQFGALESLAQTYRRITELPVHPRHPYAGELVFTAFSGSHQDAIHKGMTARRTLLDKLKTLLEFAALQEKYPSFGKSDIERMLDKILTEFWPDNRVEQTAVIFRRARQLGSGLAQRYLEEHLPWDVPYLPMDPQDLGRTYDSIVRFNSQSGKGGAAYLLKSEFGLEIPKTMHPLLGKVASAKSDQLGRELSGKEVYQVFNQTFVNLSSPYSLISYQCLRQEISGETLTKVTLLAPEQQRRQIEASGNGPINAFINGVNTLELLPSLRLEHYHEQALSLGSASNAIAYIQLSNGQKPDDRQSFWGVGVDSDTTAASFKAIIGALNQLLDAQTAAPTQIKQFVHE